MSDDSFIREVNEELRQDQFKALWRRYGVLAIAAVALVVLATAAYVGYESWTTSRANQSGDAYARATDLAESDDLDGALEVLATLESEGYGSYPALARLRAGAILADTGRPEEAIARFDAASADTSAPAALRDMARLRAALLLVDHGSYSDVAARAETLTADGNPLRHTAREALALAAWKEGDRDSALALFGQLADDSAAPASIRQRAEMMTELISGSAGESG